MSKLKEHIFDLTYAIQDVWAEAERMTSMAKHLGYLNPTENTRDEMEHNVKFLLLQRSLLSVPAFEKAFEEVFKEEGLNL